MRVWLSTFLLNDRNCDVVFAACVGHVETFRLLQEFMRVGYYVSTDYWEEEYREMETPPNPPLIHKYAA